MTERWAAARASLRLQVCRVQCAGWQVTAGSSHEQFFMIHRRPGAPSKRCVQTVVSTLAHTGRSAAAVVHDLEMSR